MSEFSPVNDEVYTSQGQSVTTATLFPFFFSPERMIADRHSVARVWVSVQDQCSCPCGQVTTKRKE